MPIEEIQAAVDDAISPEQAIKLRRYPNHIDELQKHIETVEQEIPRLSDPYPSSLQADSHCSHNDQSSKMIKLKKHSEFTNRYRCIKTHHGHKKANIAICHMILTATSLFQTFSIKFQNISIR